HHFNQLEVVTVLHTATTGNNRVTAQLEGMRYLRAASESLESNPRLSLLLAVEGAQRNPGPEARNALYAALAPALAAERELPGLAGHTDWVRRARFDATGSRLVSVARDGTARIFEGDSALATLRGHQSEVLDGCLDPTGQRAVTGSYDGTARLWDTATAATLQRLDCGSPVYFARFVAAGAQVVTASTDGMVRVWSVADGSLLAAALLLPALDFSSMRLLYRDVAQLALSPDGQLLAAVGSDGKLRCWEATQLREVWSVSLGSVRQANFVEFAPDGSALAIAALQGPQKLFVVSADGTHRLQLPQAEVLVAVNALSWSRSGQQLAVADGNSVLVYDVASAQLAARLVAPVGSPHSLCFANDDQLVCRGLRSGVVELWDIATATKQRELIGHDAPLHWLTANAAGTQLVTAGEDSRVRRWAVGESGSSVQLTAAANKRSAMFLTATEYAACGEAVTIVAPDQAPRELPIRARFVARVADEELLVVTRNTIDVWPRGAARPTNLVTDPDAIRCAAITDDQRRIGVGTTSDKGLAGRVVLYDRQRGTTITWAAHAGPIRDIAFDAQGERVATASLDRSVGVWSTDTGECEWRLQGHSADVRSVAFHPRRALLVSGGWDGTVLLWNLKDGSVTRQWRAHTTSVEALEWAPDGAELCSVAYGGEVRFWDSSNRCVSLQSCDQSITSADLSPDGTSILLVTLDGRVHCSPYPPDAAAQALCPDPKFYARELRALQFPVDAPTLPTTSELDHLQQTLDVWSRLREPARSSAEAADVLTAAQALSGSLQEPRFMALLVAIAHYRAAAFPEAIEQLQAIADAAQAAQAPVDPLAHAFLALALRAVGASDAQVDKHKLLAKAAASRTLPGEHDVDRILRELDVAPR
ncbi:MAG: WD40 repeat domain-containing protein, partial [Planctomycetota bacterium]